MTGQRDQLARMLAERYGGEQLEMADTIIAAGYSRPHAAEEGERDEVRMQLAYFIDAFDSGAVRMESEEIDLNNGKQPHPWHEEWLAHARKALTGYSRRTEATPDLTPLASAVHSYLTSRIGLVLFPGTVEAVMAEFDKAKSRRTETTGEARDQIEAALIDYADHDDHVKLRDELHSVVTAHARAAKERATRAENERCSGIADAVAEMDMQGARFRSFHEVAQYIAAAIRALRGQSTDQSVASQGNEK